MSLFSFLLSSIVERWVALSGLPMVFFGLILVSLGAEIPDTIESVTVARKGYGSMAVSNCQGKEQVDNSSYVNLLRNTSHQYLPRFGSALACDNT